jgi:hypothetical protein
VPSHQTVLRATRMRPSGRRWTRSMGERWAEQLAAELSKAGTVVEGDPDVGVEVEAIESWAWRGPREVA